MPWKEASPVDQRTQSIADFLRDALSITELCALYGVSRKTGYQWIDRYLCQGPAGLEEIDDGIWNVYFGPLRLGRLHERRMRLEDEYGRLLASAPTLSFSGGAEQREPVVGPSRRHRPTSSRGARSEVVRPSPVSKTSLERRCRDRRSGRSQESTVRDRFSLD